MMTIQIMLVRQCVQIRINDVVWNKEKKHFGKETKTVELTPVSEGQVTTSGTKKDRCNI